MILASSFPYTGNGLGGLPDAIEAVVSHEINGIYELMLRYPITGLHFDELENGRIIMAEPDNLTNEQPFRIYRITKPLNGVVTVYARHLCYDMQGIIVEPFTAGSLTEAFQTIPTVLTPANSFSLQTTRTVASGMSIAEPRPLWKLLGGQAGSILDVYGGEWDFDGYDVKLMTRLGTDRGVRIAYGKNMTELEQDASIEATYSGVYPYWYDEESSTLVTLPEKYVSVSGSLVTDRVLSLDCSGDFEDAPTEAQLRARANAYITANSIGNASTSWKVSFVDDPTLMAEQVMLGDTLHVHYERMNVDATARAVKTEYDVLAKHYKSITVGKVKQNLAQILVAQKEETASEFAAVKSALETAVDDATDFIRNGGGYMRFIYDANDYLTEIVSLDDPDITQAQSVWRWNNGGFGHSSTGYNGQYTLAITQNGAIVADFITAGTLNANVIRAGILQDSQGKNSWNLDTGAFTITDGSINITTNSETYDVIKFQNNQWRNTFSPLEYRIYNTTTQKAIIVQAHAIFSYDNYDGNGNEIVRSILSGSSLFQNDASGNQRTLLTDGYLSLSDQNQTTRTKIDDTGKLWQYDANGKKRTYLEYGDIMLYTAAEVQTAKLSGSTFAGGGSLQLYDTAATERARVLTDGLYFYNSSGTLLTKYDPASYDFQTKTVSIGTGWTSAQVGGTYDAGLWVFAARLAYSAAQPRGIAIVASAVGGSYDYNLAVNENYQSITGRTVQYLWTSAVVRLDNTWTVTTYAKSASTNNEQVQFIAMRIA